MIKIHKRPFKWFVFDWYYNLNSFPTVSRRFIIMLLEPQDMEDQKVWHQSGINMFSLKKTTLNFEYLLQSWF